MLASMRAFAPCLALLLALVVLGVRLSGVHAHRDLGAAPASALHEQGHHAHGHGHADHGAPADADRGHGAHAEGTIDVELDALTSAFEGVAKLGALLLAVALLLPACARSAPRPPGSIGPRTRSHLHWRPPLRGPPQASIA